MNRGGDILTGMILSACATSASGNATQPAISTQAPTQGSTPTSATTESPTTSASQATTPAAIQSGTPSTSTNTIIIGTTDSIASLDQADAYARRDWELIKNICEGLLVWKAGTIDLAPGLATDMGTVSSDGLTYTFTLKDGIKFGDGTPSTRAFTPNSLTGC